MIDNVFLDISGSRISIAGKQTMDPLKSSLYRFMYFASLQQTILPSLTWAMTVRET